MRHLIVALITATTFATPHAAAADSPVLPGFRRSAWFDEQVWEAWVETGVRVLVNVPPVMHPNRPTRLILFATPNGNTIEQRIVTIGLTSGDFVEVKDGLKEGDVVVTRAGTFLRDGDIVRPIVPEAALSEAN